jgi:uncharacterized protein YjeT (DUF2065 family)
MDAPKRKKDGQAAIRKMGISLLVLGTVVIAVGVAAFRQGPNLRDTLLLAFGAVLFVAGIYTWRSARN